MSVCLILIECMHVKTPVMKSMNLKCTISFLNGIAETKQNLLSATFLYFFTSYFCMQNLIKKKMLRKLNKIDVEIVKNKA